MAVFHGKEGEVRWDTTTGNEVEVEHVTNWTATVTADVAEATAMGDTYKSRTVGFKDWTATVTCYLDETGSDVPLVEGGTEAVGERTPAELELYFDSTGGAGNVKLLYGTAVCTDVAFNVDADGNPTVTYSFVGQDTSGLTWATTAPV